MATTTTTLDPAAARAERQTRNTSLDLVRRVLRVRLAPLAVALLATFLLMAAAADLIQRYDPIKDLAPISLIANIPAILLVKPSSPYNTIQQIIAAAKANPGKLTFSSSGVGGTAHLSAQMLKIMAGVDMLHVPYRGTGPAIAAVMGGQVTMTFADVISGLPYVKGGQLKAVAFTTPGHLAALPKLPSIASVLPGYSATVWYGVLAPAKTPKAIVAKLNKALVQAVHSPGMVKTLANEGVTPIGDSPEQFARFIKEDGARWSKIIHESGMKPE